MQFASKQYLTGLSVVEGREFLVLSVVMQLLGKFCLQLDGTV